MNQMLTINTTKVIMVGPTLTMFVDDFDAKSSGARGDRPGRIRTH